jgi:Ca2+-binding EF-hand superfamily protein
MRTLSLALSITFAMLGATSVFAQKPKTPDKPAATAPSKPAWSPYSAIQQFKIISALDADLDGTITGKEIEGAVERIKKLDSDGDGKLSTEEFLKEKPIGSAVSNFGVVKELDVDKNSELNAEEISGAVAALKKADKDKNGKLDSTEYAMKSPMSMGGGGGGGPGASAGGGGGRAMPTPEEFVKQNDKNGDGKVAKTELTGMIVGFFDRMDTDKDGFVTVEEVKASRERRREQNSGAEGDKKIDAPKTDAPKAPK